MKFLNFISTDWFTQKAFLTVVFYALVLSFVFYDTTYGHTKSATDPGWGAVVFMWLIPISFLRFLRNVYITIMVNKANIWTTLVHFLFLLGAFIRFNF